MCHLYGASEVVARAGKSRRPEESIAGSHGALPLGITAADGLKTRLLDGR